MNWGKINRRRQFGALSFSTVFCSEALTLSKQTINSNILLVIFFSFVVYSSVGSIHFDSPDSVAFHPFQANIDYILRLVSFFSFILDTYISNRMCPISWQEVTLCSTIQKKTHLTSQFDYQTRNRDSNWKSIKNEVCVFVHCLDPFAMHHIASRETALSVIVLLFFWHVVSSYPIYPPISVHFSIHLTKFSFCLCFAALWSNHGNKIIFEQRVWQSSYFREHGKSIFLLKLNVCVCF